jgi:hypothetical protein
MKNSLLWEDVGRTTDSDIAMHEEWGREEEFDFQGMSFRCPALETGICNTGQL